MLKLDNNLLQELGLGSLPEEQKKAMLQHIYETLELRVGTNLANQMTDQQLEEFEKFIDDGGDANQAQALQWLESNLPNYKEVVNQVFEQLKGEIGQMAPQIMASSSATPNTAVTQQPQQVQAGGHGQYQASQPLQAAQPAPQQPYQPPAVPQQPPASYQQPPAAQSDYQQPFAGQAPQSMQQQTYQQPQPGGYQPAPQGFQAPQPAQQQPYPPIADTQQQPQNPDQQAT